MRGKKIQIDPLLKNNFFPLMALVGAWFVILVKGRDIWAIKPFLWSCFVKAFFFVHVGLSSSSETPCLSQFTYVTDILFFPYTSSSSVSSSLPSAPFSTTPVLLGKSPIEKRDFIHLWVISRFFVALKAVFVMQISWWSLAPSKVLSWQEHFNFFSPESQFQKLRHYDVSLSLIDELINT